MKYDYQYNRGLKLVKMSLPGHNSHLSNWKRFTTTSETPAKKKVQLNDVDIDQWRKRVEMASESAVSEVFHLKKSGISSHMVALQHTDQLQDHDNAYSEAQALLSDWMNSKLRLELEVGEDDEHQLRCSTETSGPGHAFDTAPTTALDYSNFNEMYNHLAEEKEDCAVSSFLRDLMELEVLDSGVAEDMVLDTERKKRKTIRDPTIAMEARHRQVRENRAQRDAERETQQRERDARREAREEAKRRERAEEARRKQEAHGQEEMVRQEMVRLRRGMEEKQGLEQRVRQRERERRDRERAASCLQSGPPLPTKQQDQDRENIYREQQIQARKQMVHLKSLQKHFSGWYSVLLQQRIRQGKAAALCDWKRQLRVWRAWRALVWAGTRQREAQRTEEELRTENRRCQIAMESDRRRQMKRCFYEWQLWCRRQKEQRELLSQQEKTRRKMAALLSAASTGKLNTTMEPTAPETMAATPEMTDQPETTERVKDITTTTQPHIRKDTQEDHQRSGTRALKLHPGNPLVGAVARPTQPWQVTRRHAALTEGELHQARLRGDHAGATVPSQSKSAGASRFEHRHAAQQQTIAQQRKLLRDQQQQIAQLQEERGIVGVKPEAQGAAELTPLPFHEVSKPGGLNLDLEEQRVHRIPEGKDEPSMPLRKAIIRRPSPHPIVMAMEERARQRKERRSEAEELKRKKEREKLAGMKAAEEQRQREEEEEKCRVVERKREEKRLQREREQERRKQVERLQVLHRLARLHHHRTLLVRCGLEPWKCLLQLSQANGQLADGHRNLSVMRRCVLAWQRLASHAYAQKCASADRLHQHFLLRRGLRCWKRLKDWRMIQEARAERFHRMHTLRRILLALLDHVTQERLTEWDRQELAQGHSDRRVLRGCFLAWRQFPGLLRMEREREVRREKLRRRVAEVLPDFHSSPLECLREQPLL